MASVTIRFSAILILLGVLFYATTGQHVTSLIPAFFGIVLLAFGLMARTADTKKRMIVMHIAVTVALIGFIFPAVRAGMAYAQKVPGMPLEHMMAVREEMLMAVICLVFVLLCVRSFIAARKARLG